MTTYPATPKPIYKKQLRYGIAAAVFEKTHEGRTTRSVNLQKSYKRNGEWVRHNIYIDHHHIPFMIEALSATWDYLNAGHGEPDTGETESALEVD